MSDVEIVAETDMLVRRGAAEVFDAFVEPRMLERFWLRHASGPLTAGQTVDWQFMADGSTERVSVTRLEPPALIDFTWSDGLDVKIRIEPFDEEAARVHVLAGPFEGEAAVSTAVAATAGFTIVLCDLKTVLETGSSANLVKDKALLIDADDPST